MDDPIFRMRAKVAKAARGHQFEERFLNLSGLQLAVAYRQAVKEEEEKFELVKTMNEMWSKKFDNLFKALYMYSNPSMYASYLEAKELEKLRGEVKVEEFPELWDEIMQIIPNEIVVEEPESDPMAHIPKVEPETEEILAGFIPYAFGKDGE